jgi:hypothetical protein
MKPYYWFQGPSVRELVDRIIEAGVDTCRVEVHEHGEGEKSSATFIVRAAPDGLSLATADGEGCEPVNDSHRCPPDC